MIGEIFLTNFSLTETNVVLPIFQRVKSLSIILIFGETPFLFENVYLY